jgi:hypothetical protein
VRRADNLNTLMCRLSRNSGSPNILESKGPIQACNTIVVPPKIDSDGQLLYVSSFLTYPTTGLFKPCVKFVYTVITIYIDVPQKTVTMH